MEESKNEKNWTWMADLSNKYDISIETVLSFYMSLSDAYNMSKRERVEEFFRTYFEELRRDNNG